MSVSDPSSLAQTTQKLSPRLRTGIPQALNASSPVTATSAPDESTNTKRLPESGMAKRSPLLETARSSYFSLSKIFLPPEAKYPFT